MAANTNQIYSWVLEWIYILAKPLGCISMQVRCVSFENIGNS